MPNVKCIVCGNEFYAKPNNIARGWGKYCSKNCQAQGQRKGRFVNCDICSKNVWKMPKALNQSKSGKYFCGKHCQTIWRNKFFSGIRHPNWKNGEHQEYRRYLIENGRKMVCETCGIVDKRVLVVHHKDKKRTNNQLENLVWLCHNCHYLVHYHNVVTK